MIDYILNLFRKKIKVAYHADGTKIGVVKEEIYKAGMIIVERNGSFECIPSNGIKIITQKE